MSKSYETRMDILKSESQKTMNDLVDKLHAYGRCLCVRPTGFGKTYLLVNIAYKYIEKYPDKKIMYVMPSNIIETEIRNNKGYNQELIDKYFEFVTYQALSKSVGETGTLKSRQRYLDMLGNCSVCLLDEVHRSAAEGYVNFYEYTEEYYTKDRVNLVGVTATPIRHDESESEWIYSTLFEGHETYEYTLGDAIASELLLKPIYCMAKFDVPALKEEMKSKIKKAHLKANGFFNEADFETSFNKAYRSNGTEAEIIYKNIKKAGYNLSSDNPDDSYLKFIVFFSNTQDLVENGEATEKWFFDAVEKYASEDYGKPIKFNKHVDYVISSTADQNNDFMVKNHVDKKNYRSCVYNASEVGNNDTYKGHHIDLIFNVNIITMGYHVEHISGIMMRRGTGTDIMYYQQLGRCFSVKALRPSIVFDLAYNKNTQKNRDKKRLFATSSIENDNSQNLVRSVSSSSSQSERNTDLEEAFVVDFETGIDDLLDKWADPNYSYVSRAKYLYEDRSMPIALIAQDLGLSCTQVTKYLVDAGVSLRYETPMFEFLNHDDVLNDATSNELNLLRFLYSKKAYSIFTKVKSGTKRGVKTLFAFIVKYLGGSDNG